jgi:hypothetical protein
MTRRAVHASRKVEGCRGSQDVRKTAEGEAQLGALQKLNCQQHCGETESAGVGNPLWIRDAHRGLIVTSCLVAAGFATT